MSDADDDSPFQQIYDWLVLSNAQWTNPFHVGNEIARKWAGTAIERLAMMAGGQEIEFAAGGFTTDGFDTTASATIFTKHMRLELAPTTLRGGSAWQPSKVVSSPRAALYEATLLESSGPAEKPWGMVLELRYQDRDEVKPFGVVFWRCDPSWLGQALMGRMSVVTSSVGGAVRASVLARSSRLK